MDSHNEVVSPDHYYRYAYYRHTGRTSYNYESLYRTKDGRPNVSNISVTL